MLQSARLDDRSLSRPGPPSPQAKGGEAAAAASDARPLPAACEKCGGGHAPDRILPCARCPKGWHTFCLAPPLEAPPAGEWVCPDCRAQGEQQAAQARFNAMACIKIASAREVAGGGSCVRWQLCAPLAAARPGSPGPTRWYRAPRGTAEFEAFAFQDADDYSLEEFEGIAATFEEQWFGADRDKVCRGEGGRRHPGAALATCDHRVVRLFGATAGQWVALPAAQPASHPACHTVDGILALRGRCVCLCFFP